MSKQNTDYLFVQMPEDLRYRPRYWSPEMAYHMTHLQEEGSDVAIIDWASHRVNHNVIVNEIEKFDYEELVLWGGPSTYRYIKQIQDQIGDFTVGGMTPHMGKKLDLETFDDITQTFKSNLPDPFLGFFDQTYFAESKLPYNAETLTWKQRIPQRYHLHRKLKSKDAAIISRQTKIKWWYDSVDWLDDVTDNEKWTRRYLNELSRMSVGFQYTCKARDTRINPPLLKLLRETGCKVIDYGNIHVSDITESGTFLRLQGACVEARKHKIFPSFTFILNKNTTIEDCGVATKFLHSIDGLHRPKVHKPYGAAEDEETILKMNNDTYNPTEFTWIELYGIQTAMQRGTLEAF